MLKEEVKFIRRAACDTVHWLYTLEQQNHELVNKKLEYERLMEQLILQVQESKSESESTASDYCTEMLDMQTRMRQLKSDGDAALRECQDGLEAKQCEVDAALLQMPSLSNPASYEHSPPPTPCTGSTDIFDVPS